MRLEAVVPLQWVDRAYGIVTVQVCVWRWKELPKLALRIPTRWNCHDGTNRSG